MNCILLVSIPFSVYEKIGVIKAAGVEIRDIRSTLVPVRKELQQDFDLESYTFVPFVLNEVRTYNNFYIFINKYNSLFFGYYVSYFVRP